MIWFDDSSFTHISFKQGCVACTAVLGVPQGPGDQQNTGRLPQEMLATLDSFLLVTLSSSLLVTLSSSLLVTMSFSSHVFLCRSTNYNKILMMIIMTFRNLRWIYRVFRWWDGQCHEGVRLPPCPPARPPEGRVHTSEAQQAVPNVHRGGEEGTGGEGVGYRCELFLLFLLLHRYSCCYTVIRVVTPLFVLLYRYSCCYTVIRVIIPLFVLLFRYSCCYSIICTPLLSFLLRSSIWVILAIILVILSRLLCYLLRS